MTMRVVNTLIFQFKNMATKNIKTLDSAVQQNTNRQISKSQLILKHTHESTAAFLKAFDDYRGTGATTDEQQDLLRAMLVFSLAGLDSLLKQIIHDVLPKLVNSDDKVKEGLETFLSRKIRNEAQDNNINNKFLAKLLLAESLKDNIIYEYICELTGKSLQSAEELIKTIYALGLEPSTLDIETITLKPIFDSRNKIIHEFDIDFNAPRRNRVSRNRNTMIDSTNKILKISEKIFLKISEKITP